MYLHDPGQDRLVTDLYVWICVNKRTQLEGVFAVNLNGTDFQCATSNLETAKRMMPLLRNMNDPDKKFRLVRFSKAEILEEI